MGIRRTALSLPPSTRDPLATYLLDCGDRLLATAPIATSCCDFEIDAGTEFTIVRKGDSSFVVRVGPYRLPSDLVTKSQPDYHHVVAELLADRYEVLATDASHSHASASLNSNL